MAAATQVRLLVLSLLTYSARIAMLDIHQCEPTMIHTSADSSLIHPHTHRNDVPPNAGLPCRPAPTSKNTYPLMAAWPAYTPPAFLTTDPQPISAIHGLRHCVLCLQPCIRPHRLVVRTSRCGSDNPGSNPGESTLNSDCCLRARASLLAPSAHLGGSLHPSRSVTKTLTSYVCLV